MSVAALLLAVPGHVSAAPISDHSHESLSDSFPNSFCGIDGTSVVREVVNFKRFADRTFIENVTFTETFTATASEKSIVIKGGYHFSRRSTPIDNGDGTLTFIVTFAGLYEQLRIAKGPVLSIDAGTVTIANTFAIDEDGTSTFLSSTIVGVHGPHPDWLSDFAIFCDVIVPALT